MSFIAIEVDWICISISRQICTQKISIGIVSISEPFYRQYQRDVMWGSRSKGVPAPGLFSYVQTKHVSVAADYAHCTYVVTIY